MSSNTPRVNISFSNDNLQKEILAIDGYAALMGTAQLELNKNKVFQFVSLADAVAQGITEDDEPVIYKHLKEFYTELGGNQLIYGLFCDEDVTMAEMLDGTSVDFAVKLLKAANGKVSLLGIYRTPPVGYDAGDSFFDTDCEEALTATKSLMAAMNAQLIFSRIIIEGRISDESSNDVLTVSSIETDFAGLLLGDTVEGKSAAIGMILGRKMRYPCHIKIGKVANGSLSANEIYIGTKKLEEVANMDTLHGKGVISFLTYPNKAGFFFGIDKMANTRDYRLLVYGCVIDAVANVAGAVFIDDLEGEVDTNPDGTIKDLDAKHMEDTISQQVSVTLAERISGFTPLVDRTVNIIETSKTKLKLRARPKGYNTWIELDLGLTAGN